MVSPTDATIQKVRWYSDDESIATVDSEGLVSPLRCRNNRHLRKNGGRRLYGKMHGYRYNMGKRKEDIPVVYTDYDMTVDEMVEEQMTAEPAVFTNGVFPGE